MEELPMSLFQGFQEPKKRNKWFNKDQKQIPHYIFLLRWLLLTYNFSHSYRYVKPFFNNYDHIPKQHKPVSCLQALQIQGNIAT